VPGYPLNNSLPLGLREKGIKGRAVIYFSRSVGKDITTAATLLVVCGENHTLGKQLGRYGGEHSKKELSRALLN
jgi:hypothetical protein